MIGEQEKAKEEIRFAWFKGEMSSEERGRRVKGVDEGIAAWRRRLEENEAVEEGERSIAECEGKWVVKMKEVALSPEDK